jgi:hypothetical protein
VRTTERAIERIEQAPELLVPADNGTVHAPRDRLAAADADQPVSGNPLGLAL